MYNEGLELEPDNFRLLGNRGLVYMVMGNYINAMHDYLNALKTGPPDYFNLANLGDLYYRQGEYVNALKYFDESLQIYPQYSFYSAK